MRKNDIIKGSTFRESLLIGVNKVSDVVGSTLGAKGSNVAIQKEFGNPHVTKDGVTVAKSIHLKDSVENIGCQLIREASDHTNSLAGDGTTSSTVLSQALVNLSEKYLNSGVNGNELRKYIEKHAVDTLKTLKDITVQISDDADILEIAKVSSNGDEEMSKIVTSAFSDVGADGTITLESSLDGVSRYEKKEGYSFEGGIYAPYFATDLSKMSAVVQNARVLISCDIIEDIASISKLLENAIRTSQPIVIIAKEFSKNVVEKLTIAKMQNNFNVTLIKAPYLGNTQKEMLEDISTIIDTKVYSELDGVDITKAEMSDLGLVAKIESTKDSTTILKDDSQTSSKTLDRIKYLKSRIDGQSEFKKNEITKRIAKLSGGVGVIYIGAITEAEMVEKKDRFEDTLSSVRASLDEGIVVGSGYAYLHMTRHLEDSLAYIDNGVESFAINILIDALKSVTRKICTNAGLPADVIINEMLTSSLKYNIMTDVYYDYDAKVLNDPVKVVRLAFSHAVSVAGIIMTMDSAVTLLPADDDSMKYMSEGGGMPPMM